MSKALLVGTPNSGKTALFNRLTGLNQRVANYPGITVDISVGRMKGSKTGTWWIFRERILYDPFLKKSGLP